jgi:carboxylesterase type B
VNKEIVQFGGDKTALTVGGHGVGAQLVGYLTLSPMANGLFSHAVALSGAPEMNHKLTTGANSVLSEQLVNLNKCHQHAQTMSCMRKLSANALLSTGYFGPTIDNEVFVANVSELRKTRKPLPYLIGVSSQNTSHHYSTEESCLTAAHSLALMSEVVVEKCKEHYDNTSKHRSHQSPASFRHKLLI